MVEGARLERVYGLIAHRGFESLPHCQSGFTDDITVSQHPPLTSMTSQVPALTTKDQSCIDRKSCRKVTNVPVCKAMRIRAIKS